MRRGRAKSGLLGVAVVLVALAVFPWVGGTATCTDPAAGEGACIANGPFMGPIAAVTWSVLCVIAAAWTGWRALTPNTRASLRSD